MTTSWARLVPSRLEALEALEAGAPADSAATEHEAEGDADIDGRRSLCCRQCGQRVTQEEDRASITGEREHVFVNPAGSVYRVGCFRVAPGCHGVGEPTAFFSWFPGYPWRVAFCRGCQQHLGWVYGVPADFYGLILDRLVPCDSR